jgi:hypothetical protein
MCAKTNTIEIPHSLYVQLESRLKESGFNTIDAFVSAIIEAYMDTMDKSIDADDKAVRERLKKLGYIS